MRTSEVTRDLPAALTYEEAARELSTSVRSLRRMVERGEIRDVPLGGRGRGIRTRRVIPRTEIEGYLERKLNDPE